MPAPRPSRRDRARRGAVSVEALFAVPLLLAVVLGIVGVADLIVTEQVLAEASGRGARAAALGGTPHEVEAAVRAVLGPDRSRHARIFAGPADGHHYGHRPVPPGGLIEVRVVIAARDATATPFAPVGGDERLVGRTVMQRE